MSRSSHEKQSENPMTTSKTNRVLIGLGSNKDPEANIELSIRELSKIVRIVTLSRFEKTRPVDDSTAPAYLNGIALIETTLQKEELKDLLKQIEERQNRQSVQQATQLITIDLDILVWNGNVVDESFERIPFLKRAAQEIESVMTPTAKR